jgi:hypothetical protein
MEEVKSPVAERTGHKADALGKFELDKFEAGKTMILRANINTEWHAHEAKLLCFDETKSFLDGKSVHLVRVPHAVSGSVLEIANSAIDRILKTKFAHLDLFHGAASADSRTFSVELHCDHHIDCRY